MSSAASWRLRARGLSKTYRRGGWTPAGGREAAALRNADLDLAAGSALLLLGGSGAGKSTLARCLAGWEHPDAGEIAFLDGGPGEAGGGRTAPPPGAIQLVPQDPAAAFNPRFCLEEIIAEPLAIRGTPAAHRRARARELLAAVGLPIEWGGRRAEQLSGGERQRLAIARGLAAEARVVIFDESFSGLDAPARREVLALLAAARRERSAAHIFIAHDLEMATVAADEIALMEEGRVVEVAAAESFLLRPQTAAARRQVLADRALDEEPRPAEARQSAPYPADGTAEARP